MLTIARIFLYLQTLGLSLLGLYFWAQPAAAGTLLGVSALNAAGSNEMRGFFGGGFLTLAALILWGLRSRSALATGGLIAVSAMMTLIVIGRLVGFVVDGVHPNSIGAAVFEGLILLACAALVRERNQGGAH